MNNTRKKLLRFASILGHIRVNKTTGERTVVSPHTRKIPSKARPEVKKVSE